MRFGTWKVRSLYNAGSLVTVATEIRRLGHRWEDNIKMDISEIGWGGMDVIVLTQDRNQWRVSCEHGNEPSGSVKGSEFLE
jgi:hypothetical protein